MEYANIYGDYTHYLISVFVCRIDVKALSQSLISLIVQLLELVLLKCSSKNLSILLRAFRNLVSFLPNPTIFKIFDRIAPIMGSDNQRRSAE